MKLRQKILLTINAIIIFIVVGLSIFMISEWLYSLKLQLSKEALDMAISISENVEIKENIVKDNGYIKIQNLSENLRLKTRSQYIYIINSDGLYFSNPYSHKIGTITDSQYIQSVMTNRESIIVADNGLNSITEAYVPVYYEGEFSGVIVVGLLNGRLFQEVKFSLVKLIVGIIISLLFGAAGSVILSNNIKKSISNLEPQEISYLLAQKEMVIENMNVGIMSIDLEHKIILINQKAKMFLGLCDEDIGKPLLNSTLLDGFKKILNDEDSPIMQRIRAGTGIELLGKFHSMINAQNKIIGAALTLEDITLIKMQAEEVIGLKQLNDSLRSQNHEFLNKLHTISGLIQLNKPDKALEFIDYNIVVRKEMIETITNGIKIGDVAGLLLSKYNKITESKISFIIDKASILETLPNGMSGNDMCTIIGNFIENAFDATVNMLKGRIFIGIYEDKSQGILEIIVEDNGAGISEDIVDNIFDKNISSKGKGRGIGLYLVNELVKEYNGSIETIVDEGTTFVITFKESVD